VKNKSEHPVFLPEETRVLLKIGPYFIQKTEIQSCARFGKGTKIMLVNGDELTVNIRYERVAELLGK
jgi:hypothetical protein